MAHDARAFDSGVSLWQGAARLAGTACPSIIVEKVLKHMVKPEWGTKRSCPKCGTRFYDLGKEDPVVCISCGNQWIPEPVLKSKQPMPFEEVKKDDQVSVDADLGDDLVDLEVDEDAEISPDDEVDIGGDDDLGVDTGDTQDDV
jgi:uncharacterized protein (TIGR02300 family)